MGKDSRRVPIIRVKGKYKEGKVIKVEENVSEVVCRESGKRNMAIVELGEVVKNLLKKIKGNWGNKKNMIMISFYNK